MGEADIAALSKLIEDASAADGHRALGEHKWLDLTDGGREGFSGFVARESGHHRVIGYAQLSRGSGRSWAIEYVVHPEFRAGERSLGVDLVGAALGEIASEGGGHVHLWVPKPGEVDDAVAADVGLRRGRDLFQMRRRLPVRGLRSTVATRAFRPGQDEAAWLEVNNAAFNSHPEQGSWTLATLADREAQPWFDPSGFLLYEKDGELAGFCWTKIHDEAGELLGEIYVVAVAPVHQGRGLGGEMVLAGLEHLAGEGVATGILYVDRENAAARALYRRLGFVDDHVDRAYTGDVGPAGR